MQEAARAANEALGKRYGDSRQDLVGVPFNGILVARSELDS
jgi:hypothetical protein